MNVFRRFDHNASNLMTRGKKRGFSILLITVFASHLLSSLIISVSRYSSPILVFLLGFIFSYLIIAGFEQ